MQGTHDIDHAAPADNGEQFDPQEAARVLAEARREAEREFSLTPPLISLVMGAIILGAYIALWLSTQDQHLYKGPSVGLVGLVYGAVAVAIALSVTVYRRATAGVSGPSLRQQRVAGVAILISYVGSPLIQGAMKHYGASDAIVYGVIPAAGPLIIVGTTVVGTAATNADWRQCGSALAVVIAGFVALFVGPSAAWLAAGVGLFVGVVGYAAVTAGKQRAASRA